MKKKNYLISDLSNINYKYGSNLVFIDEYLYHLYEKKDLKNYNCFFVNNLKFNDNYNYKNRFILKKKLKIYRKELSVQLNNYHKTKFSEKYWGLIIDYLLILTINKIQKKIQFFKKIKKNFNNIYIEESHLKKFFLNTRETQLNIILDQNYDKFLGNVIAKEIGIKIIKKNNNKKTDKYISGDSSSINFFTNIFVFFVRLWISLFKPVVILEGYFGMRNSIKVFIKSRARVIFLSSKMLFYKKKFFFKIDSAIRNKIRVKENDLFDKIFNLILGKSLPVSFLEGFNFIRKQDSGLSKNISTIGTGVEIVTNDRFKFLSADILKKKGKLLSFQHGGNYEKGKLILPEMPEEQYATKRYLWTNKKGLGQHFLSKYKKMLFSDINKNKSILIFPTAIMLQDVPIRNIDINNHPHLDQNYDFFSNLNLKNKANVSIKLFPDSNSEVVKKVWKKRFGSSLDFSKTYSRKINYYQSRLVVINDISTPLFELMFIGTPFIIITNNKFTEYKTKFANDLKRLEKLNILYRDPIKAAKFINKNYNNIINWWKDVSNEKSFIDFKKTLFFEKKDYINLITKELVKI